MAEIICEIHGMQSVSFASPLVVERLIQERSLNGVNLMRLELSLPFEKKGVFWVDKNFLDYHDIPTSVKDESVAFEIYCELKGICSQCLKEAVESSLGK